MSTRNETAQSPLGVYEFARYQLATVAFDLSPTGAGAPERVVSAWKLIPTHILDDRDHDDCEGWILSEAVKNDLDETTALRDFDSDELDCHAEYDWFGAFIELADAYGAEDWPEAALTDYLRGFEDMAELEARVTAALMWEKAKHVYDAHKSDDAENVGARKPLAEPKKKAA